VNARGCAACPITPANDRVASDVDDCAEDSSA
jgi:hypothetical protein